MQNDRRTHPTRRSSIRSILTSVCLIAGVAVVGNPASPASVSADADPNMVPLVPARLLETRSGPNNKTIDGQHQGVGRVTARNVYTLPVAGRGGVDPDASAVMLNVTAVFPDAPGYLTVFPCTPKVPKASNVNFFAGDVAPNSVMAKVSAAGTVCIYTLATTDIVVDVTGYVPTGGAPVSVDPARLVETRRTSNDTTVDGKYEGIGRATAGETVMFKATGRAEVPGNADAVYLNVTAVFPDDFGFLTVYPCGTIRPATSNVNYGPGDVQPNAVLASVGANGMVCIYTKAATDIIADVSAYFPPGGNRVSILPERCADTRPEGKTFDGLFEADGKIAAGDTYAVRVGGRCNIASDASAAYLNVTAANAAAPGYLTVWPCDEPRPQASNVNYAPGQVQPNAVLSKISLDRNGQICIFSKAAADVIVDANGYVPAPGLFGIQQIAPTNRTTCALMGDGTVRCAGLGRYLGNGEIEESYSPSLVDGISNAVLLEAGEDSTCAVLADTKARCWGANSNGQLGDGTDVGTDGDSFDRRYSPVAVKNIDGIIDITIWDQHTCAITDDDGDEEGDTVWCWGRNNYRQVGDGSNTTQLLPVKVVGLPAGKTPVDIEAGGIHTCVLYADQTIWCWGSGGKVGRGPMGSGAQAPALIPTISDATQISAGRNHTCALHVDRTVSCWGLDNNQAIGPRDAGTPKETPAKVTGVSGVARVVAGYELTCVHHTDGTAECWGNNNYGQLGDGSPADFEPQPVPMVTGSDEKIVSVANNGNWSCALLADSSAVCWGRYLKGNFGAKLPGDSATPVVFGSGDQTT